ncbi:CinA family protein [Sphingopyxis sp. NFH-91]|uniref:CinA family protein n=1 Tax=Sphingopyxis sp. NFH-91 TaxID=2744457 RepID=UPI003FA37BB5
MTARNSSSTISLPPGPTTRFPKPRSRCCRNRCRSQRSVRAERCTVGQLAALGAAEVAPSPRFERCFTPYPIDAKCDMLDVLRAGDVRYCVVYPEGATAIAAGALARGGADVAVSVTREWDRDYRGHGRQIRTHRGGRYQICRRGRGWLTSDLGADAHRNHLSAGSDPGGD